jgi:hypothetical protein
MDYAHFVGQVMVVRQQDQLNSNNGKGDAVDEVLNVDQSVDRLSITLGTTSET